MRATLVTLFFLLASSVDATQPTAPRRSLAELVPSGTEDFAGDMLTDGTSGIITTHIGSRSSIRAAEPAMTPANATIEVSFVGPPGFARITHVNFYQFDPLPEGSTILFNIVLPSRATIPLNSFTVPAGSGGGTWWSQLWGSKFPDPWPVGVTAFEAVITDGTTGAVSFVSAEVPVRMAAAPACGPFVRAWPSEDGSEINVSVPTVSVTPPVVTLGGNKVPIVNGKISMGSLPNNDWVMTYCEGGRCSSRVVAVYRPPTN